MNVDYSPWLLACSLVVGAGASPSANAAPAPRDATPRTIEEFTVSATPLGGLEMSADRIPGRVQRSTRDEIERVPTAGLAQFLDRRMGSVFINEAQSNPLQPDVQFRGFIASPLLGQSQGVAVYQNGVRLNDPFGDIVNWALVPEPAIASIELIPGSNPVFGLNTLGGALSIRTKNGFTDPGNDFEFLAGSHGRRVAQVQSGGHWQDRLSYYVGARYLTEDGWRDHSPTDAMHVFGDVGWQNEASAVHLNATWVETDLIGNGPAPVQLLAIDRDAIYTHPDRTENSLMLMTLEGSHRFGPGHELQAVIYARRSDIDTLNGDDTIFEACDDDEAFVCEEDDEELALDENGSPIAFGPDVDGAMLNHSATRQDSYGASAQYGVTHEIAGRENRFIVGASWERSDIRFGSGAELARFDATRRAIPSHVRVADTFVGLDTDTRNWSVFFIDTLALTSRLDLTVSGRYNDARIELRDRIGTALTGTHDFDRFNPAAGLNYRLGAGLRFYASYSESNRVPSPVELTCADPEDPCALPNAFLSDPPLEQVTAKAIELGAGGTVAGLRWHAGLFRITNDDDILFISAGALTNTGFFDNVGRTRRQGFEISLDGALWNERLDWFAHYTLLDAEFRETFRVSSGNNPAAEDGEIEVRSGSRIPSVPQQLLKAGVTLHFSSNWELSAEVLYQSNQYLRGDEGNAVRPLSGFATVQLGGAWRPLPGLTLFAQIDNVFDREYGTFGLLGDADEVLGDDFDDPRFVSPGAPRSLWVGARWAWSGESSR